MFAHLKKLLTRKPKQHTFCYCPKCHNELCGSRDDLDITSYVKHFDNNTVHYKCAKCGTETRWLFDTPAPLMLEVLEDDMDRDVPSWDWRCNYLQCDWGMGLAGLDRCPGDPENKDCPEFTTEYSDYGGDGVGESGGGA